MAVCLAVTVGFICSFPYPDPVLKGTRADTRACITGKLESKQAAASVSCNTFTGLNV